ncbi:MAG: P-loop NTPase [Planctomycetota bacterium]
MNQASDLLLDHPDLPQSTHHGSAFDPVRLVRDALSGRLVFAFALAIVMGGGAAFVGWKYAEGRISYESSGLIRIVPSRPVVLYETEFSERLPTYDSFRLTQARTMQSQRLLDLAAADPKLQASGWPGGPAGSTALRNSLSVKVPRGEEMIVVAVRTATPEVAQAATDAVLRAYERLEIDTASQAFASIQAELVRLRDRYRRELDEAREEGLRLAEQHGTDDLKRASLAMYNGLVAIDERIVAVQIEIASAPEGDVEPATEGEAEVKTAEISIEELAPYDEQLSGLVRTIAAARVNVASLEKQLRPEHRELRAAKRELAAMEEQAELMAEGVRARFSSGGGSPGVLGRTKAGLEAEYQRLVGLRTELAAESVELGRTQLRIDRERQKAEEASQKLSETNQRIEALRVEQGESRVGRAEIKQMAERVSAPASDKRKQMAAAGFVGGFGAGVGLVALPGLVWPRFRTVQHVAARGSEFELLGIIPEMTSRHEAIDEMLQANLRQIVTRLEAEVLREANASRVYAVTSGMAGEGKTSLTTALATVLARQGQRTLVIDADVDGRALTDQFGLTDEPGLQEVVAGDVAWDDLNLESVYGFQVLPVGVGAEARKRAIGPRDIESIIGQINGTYDSILVDTGPILGSSEAAAVAVNSGRTILVVSRGQEASVVNAAQRRLSQLGVKRIGVVFNRASRADVARDPTSMSMSMSTSTISVRKPRGSRLKLIHAAGLGKSSPEDSAADKAG